MSPRLVIVLLISLTAVAGSAANAASFSTNMNTRMTGPGVSAGQTTTLAPVPTHRGYGGAGGSYPPPAYGGGQRPPRLTTFNSNDQFDTNGNLNPGSGGGDFKPSKTPAHK